MTTPLPNCGGVVPDIRALRDLAEFFLPAFHGPTWKGKRYETEDDVVETMLELWGRAEPLHGNRYATGGITLIYLDYGPDGDGPRIEVALQTHCDVSLYVAPERRDGRIALVPQPVAQGDPAPN